MAAYRTLIILLLLFLPTVQAQDVATIISESNINLQQNIDGIVRTAVQEEFEENNAALEETVLAQTNFITTKAEAFLLALIIGVFSATLSAFFFSFLILKKLTGFPYETQEEIEVEVRPKGMPDNDQDLKLWHQSEYWRLEHG